MLVMSLEFPGTSLWIEVLLKNPIGFCPLPLRLRYLRGGQHFPKRALPDQEDSKRRNWMRSDSDGCACPFRPGNGGNLKSPNISGTQNGGTHAQNSLYQVQYLHFRYLKLLVMKVLPISDSIFKMKIFGKLGENIWQLQSVGSNFQCLDYRSAQCDRLHGWSFPSRCGARSTI